jgi:hypothetical protein
MDILRYVPHFLAACLTHAEVDSDAMQVVRVVSVRDPLRLDYWEPDSYVQGKQLPRVR